MGNVSTRCATGGCAPCADATSKCYEECGAGLSEDQIHTVFSQSVLEPVTADQGRRVPQNELETSPQKRLERWHDNGLRTNSRAVNSEPLDAWRPHRDASQWSREPEKSILERSRSLDHSSSRRKTMPAAPGASPRRSGKVARQKTLGRSVHASPEAHSTLSQDNAMTRSTSSGKGGMTSQEDWTLRWIDDFDSGVHISDDGLTVTGLTGSSACRVYTDRILPRNARVSVLVEEIRFGGAVSFGVAPLSSTSLKNQPSSVPGRGDDLSIGLILYPTMSCDIEMGGEKVQPSVCGRIEVPVTVTLDWHSSRGGFEFLVNGRPTGLPLYVPEGVDSVFTAGAKDGVTLRIVHAAEGIH